MGVLSSAVKIFVILFKSTFTSKKSVEKKSDLFSLNDKKTFKPSKQLVSAIISFALIAYIVFMTYSVTSGFAAYDDNLAVAGLLLLMTQLFTLIMGLPATVNYLYFSKDKELLASLPVTPSAVFLAKFAMSYVFQIGISLIISIPTLFTYGIVKSMITGFSSVGIGYFIFSVLGSVLLPLFPLLLISVFSLPIVYLVSFLKKHKLANVLLGLLFVCFIMLISAGSSVIFGGAVGVEEDIMASLMVMLNKVSDSIVWNIPLMLAMRVKSAMSIVWFLCYLAEVIVMLGIAFGLSALFYNRVMKRGVEQGETVSKEKNKAQLSKDVFRPSSFRKTFLKKELRTFFSSTTLVLSAMLSIIMVPVLGLIFGFSFGVEVVDESGVATSTAPFFAPMFTYIGILVGTVTNTFATIAFSREGKNFYMLKTLPISAKDIIKLKSAVALGFSMIIATELALTLFGVSFSESPMFAVVNMIGVFVTTMVYYFGFDFLAIASDLKKINLKWQNITEITKKNKSVTVIYIMTILMGLLFCFGGIFLFSLLESVIELTLISIIYYGACTLISLPILILGIYSLVHNCEKRLEEIE